MDFESKVEFIINKVNSLVLKQREIIFEIIIANVSDDYIDSSNNDGSRIFIDDISENCIDLIFDKIKSFLE